MPHADPPPVSLPAPLAGRLQELALLDAPPETLEGWLDRAAAAVDAEPLRLTVGELTRGGPTRHEVDVGGERRSVPCVLDALVVARLVDERPVAIDSESPADEHVVEITVRDDGIDASPATAVVSFGVSTREEVAPDAEVPPIRAWIDPDSPIAVEPRVCRYTNAFADRAAYAAWDDTLTDAVTTAMTVDQAWSFARHALGTPLFEA